MSRISGATGKHMLPAELLFERRGNCWGTVPAIKAIAFHEFGFKVKWRSDEAIIMPLMIMESKSDSYILISIFKFHF